MTLPTKVVQLIVITLIAVGVSTFMSGTLI
jgi:hypothetical protein